jgi:uncharacterized protein
MLIGVISDTHNNLPNLNAALACFHTQNIDHILHCGDWTTVETVRHLSSVATSLDITVKGVIGNNDEVMADSLREIAGSLTNVVIKKGILRLEIDRLKVALYHGHHTPTLRNLLLDKSIDILCTGHSHKPRLEYLGNTLILNPGSVAFSIPRSKTWVPTVALIDTDNITAKIMELQLP